MPFVFRCPFCQIESEIDDAFAGQEGPCFSCGKNIQIPAADSDYYRSAANLLGQRRTHDLKRFFQATAVTLGLLILCGVSGLIVVKVILPAIGSDSPAGRLNASQANLERIAQAMKSYHADYGSLPPAYVCDAQGTPMHSWRVLLLPYLGERDLYSQYNFNEPWNGPNNSLLLGQMPRVYASPADESSAGYSETSYMVVVGSQTAFPGKQPRTMQEITDPPELTILVTEVLESKVNWMEPIDLRSTRMTFEINSRPAVEISSGHRGGALVVMADGTTHFLPDTTRPSTVRALITSIGREDVTLDDIPSD